MEDLIWRAYDVKMDARSRTVFSSAVLSTGVRMYRNEVWLVPQSGERYLNTVLYDQSPDFANAVPTLAGLPAGEAGSLPDGTTEVTEGTETEMPTH